MIYETSEQTFEGFFVSSLPRNSFNRLDRNYQCYLLFTKPALVMLVVIGEVVVSAVPPSLIFTSVTNVCFQHFRKCRM